MSTRDELAATISGTRHMRALHLEVPADIIKHVSDGITDAILAAGYRRARTITTVDELDALPFESVIRDGDECVLERWGDLEESGWVTVMVTSFVPHNQIALPATVLYEGEVTS